MRAVVYRGANDLRLETVPVPRIGPRELLVKVAACGVCPTDIKKIQYATVTPPRIFGHETAGTIVKVGEGLKADRSRRRKAGVKARIHQLLQFDVGDRVALHHHVPCLKCHACRHRAFAQCDQYKRTGITAGFEPAGGGYAEYVRVMPFVLPGVVKIPARNSFLEGAILKAVNRLNLLKGDRVLVAGQGPIGLMFTRILALRGMKVTATDLIPERLKLAREFGAVKTLNPQASTPSRSRSHSTRFDAAVIAVPSDDVVRQAQDLVRGAGQVLLFSHTRRGDSSPMDLAKICVDEKDLIGSYSADYLLQDEVADLVFSRKLNVRRLLTHEFPLEKTADAIALASKPTPAALKIVVNAELNR